TPAHPINPLLGPPQNNGGILTGAPGHTTPLLTMSLLPGSPALDAGSNAQLPAGLQFDDRGSGFDRILHNIVDIGAFELQFYATTTSLVSSGSPSVLGHSVTFTATVSGINAGGIVPSGTVNFFDGSTLLGSGTLSNGVATFTTTSLTTGS